jgi:hypothetical protein
MRDKQWYRDHPEVPVLWILSPIVGVIASVWLLSDAYGLLGAVAAGLLGGAGSALILTANRLIG